MSREYARRSRGGGNLPLIIAIIGTVIVIAVILYFVLGNGGSPFGAKETDSPYISPAPQTDSPTPGPSLTTTPTQSLIIVSPSESPSVEVITTQPPTPTPAPSYADAKVWANTLNVHEGASLDSATIGKTHRGERYKVWEETSKFLKIQMTNGVFGWVWRDYCVRGDAAMPAAPTAEPAASYVKSAVLDTGTNRITITFKDNAYSSSSKSLSEIIPIDAFTVKEGSTSKLQGFASGGTCAGGTYVVLQLENTTGATLKLTVDGDKIYDTEGEDTGDFSKEFGDGADATAPTVSFSNSGSVVTATFSETVYATSGATGTIGDGAFSVSAAMDVGGVPTATTVTHSVAHSGKTVTITLTFPDLTAGQTAQTAIVLYANSAYDAAGNTCASTSYNFNYTK